MRKIILSLISAILCLCLFSACNDSVSNGSKTSFSASKISSESYDEKINFSSLKSDNPSLSKSQSKENTAGGSDLDESIPQNIQKLLTDSVVSTTLVTDNKVDGDFIILPRVSGDGNSYIKWTSTDESVIDNCGVVYQTNEIQTVNLSASFTYGGYSLNKEYAVTVLPKKVESSQISISDNKILSKVFVSSVSDLKNALSSAKAGDAIIIKDGVYNGVSIKTTVNGTKENPVFILSENAGKAVFSGTTSLEFTGDNLVVSGLTFSSGAPKTDKGCLIFSGDYVRVTNNKIDGFCDANANKWLSLGGKYNEVDHNEFIGKTVGGALLTVWREDDGAQHHHIHHNVFKNYSSGGGQNGFETIRIGDSSQSQSDAYCLVENNYFENCDGEVEMISVKSGRNIIRNNTFVSCAGHITFRHGKNNLALNNVFLCNNKQDTGGIRMYDGGHVVKNNYVEGQNSTSDSRSAILIHSGVNSLYEKPALNAQWTAYYCLVENNTLVDCKQSILFCGKYAYSQKDITVNRNAIYGKTNGGIRINKPLDNLSSYGNVIFADSVYTDKSTQNDFSGYILNSYIEPSRNAFGIVESSEAGAFGLSVLNENSVGNY